MKDDTVFWKSGANCLLRGVKRGNACCAHSVTVVKDNAQETVLLVQPGAECA